MEMTSNHGMRGCHACTVHDSCLSKSHHLEHHLGSLHHCHNYFTYQPQVKPLTGLGKRQSRSTLDVDEPGELLGGGSASRDKPWPAFPAMNDQ